MNPSLRCKVQLVWKDWRTRHLSYKDIETLLFIVEFVCLWVVGCQVGVLGLQRQLWSIFEILYGILVSGHGLDPELDNKWRTIINEMLKMLQIQVEFYDKTFSIDGNLQGIIIMNIP